MKNSFNKFKSKIKINIKGRNIERFIRRLVKNKIEIISLERIKYNEIDIIVFKKDYEKILEIKTIYEIEIKRNYGYIRIKNIIKKNKYVIIFVLVSILIIYTLSNMIFDIEVVHSKKEIRELIKNELKNYGIEKYKFKKSYQKRELIKEKILSKYNKELEWIEIEEYGTKYKIRVEERIINKNKSIKPIQNVVAKKNGTIISVEASNGEIVKNKNDFVHKGDIIISGNIYLNDQIKKQTSADGIVYAEVWYTVKVEYPYHYKKIKKTGKKKNVFVISIFNNYYDLFNFKKYKTKKIKNNLIFKNNYVPISLIYQNQYETNEIDKIYDKDEVLYKALSKCEKELLNKLDKDSEVINYRILNKEYTSTGIKLKVFYAVKENITDYKTIAEEKIIK